MSLTYVISAYMNLFQKKEAISLVVWMKRFNFAAT